MQNEDAWDYTDVEISGIPSEAFVCAIASNGIYYRVEKSIDYSGMEPAVENEFHFLDYLGNDQVILQKENMNTYSIMGIGDDMILCNVAENGMEVIKLSPKGELDVLFNQNAPQFPFVQSCGEYMVSIRNNILDNAGLYENALILQNMVTGEEESIYRAIWDNERAVGEDLGCVSINDEMICFTLNRHYEDKESEYTLLLYNISAGEIVNEIPLRTRVYYAAYGGVDANVLLSETDDSEYIEEAGALGQIRHDAYVERAKVPFISASNMIRNGYYTGDGYYFTTYDAAYYWDVNANTVFVYNYEWIDNNISKMMVSRDGIAYVAVEGERTYVRTISVP